MARTNLDGDFNLRSAGDEAIARYLIDGVPINSGRIIETITSSKTLDDGDSTIFADATSAAIIITIPLASTLAGKIYRFKKTDSSVNTVTITAQGSDEIDGSSTAIISTQYDAVTIQSDGVSNWWII